MDAKSLTLKDFKGITLEHAKKDVKALCLHASVLKTFPTVMTALAEQLDEDNLYNALHDVAYIQTCFVNDVLSKLDLLEKMILLLNGKAISIEPLKPEDMPNK